MNDDAPVTTTIPDQVFCLSSSNGQPEWRVLLGGEMLRAVWNSKGAAEAGLVVERKRAAKRAKPPRPRPERWAAVCAAAREAYDAIDQLYTDLDDAFSELRDLRSEYEDWQSNLPDNLQNGALADKLQMVVDLDVEGDPRDTALSDIDELISNCENAELPRGFGKD